MRFAQASSSRAPAACLAVAGGGLAREDPAPAGRLFGNPAVERAGDVQHVDAGRVAVHLARTAPAARSHDALGRRGRIGERRRDEARARLDRQPHLQRVVGVHPVLMELLAVLVVLGHRDEHTRVRSLELAADREALHQRVVDADLDLVLILVNPVDRADRAVALQPQLEDVLAVERKRVPHRQAAARRERQIVARPRAAVLEPDLVDLHDRPVVGARHREAADLRRGGDVARHERRRHREHVGVVVEAEPGHVARQQLRPVDLEVEQVADDVDVFGPVHATRGHPSRIGSLGRRAIQRGFDRGDERVQRRGVGPRRTGRRHRAATQLAHDLLEHRGMLPRVGRVDACKDELAALEPVVVAGHAGTAGAAGARAVLPPEPGSPKLAERAKAAHPRPAGPACAQLSAPR